MELSWEVGWESIVSGMVTVQQRIAVVAACLMALLACAIVPKAFAAAEPTATLYSNGYFVIQRNAPVNDPTYGQVVKTFSVVERPTNPNEYVPDWAVNLTENDPLYRPDSGYTTYGDYVTNVVIKDSFRPTSTAQWFWHFTRLTTIEGLERLDTSETRSMLGMFQECRALTALDLSTFNTKNVLNMEAMFNGCSSLSTIDVSHFDLSNVQDISTMFAGCDALLNVSLSGLHAPVLQSMNSTFADCTRLTTVDLTNFDAPLLRSVTSLFANDTNLATIRLQGLKPQFIKDFSFMFSNCAALSSVDLSGFDTSLATTMRDMFAGCRTLTSLDLSSFNTERVTDMSSMFSECDALSTLKLTNFNTASVTTMYAMFSGCTLLRELDLTSFSTAAIVNNVDEEASKPGPDRERDRWQTAEMFANCDGLATIKIGAQFTFHPGGYLPSGTWTNVATGTSYSATNVPSRVAATYVREGMAPAPDAPSGPISNGEVNVYRLYNSTSGEHMYTVDANERKTLVAGGWKDEGVAWIAPQMSRTPVFRLYNPYTTDHHYTTDAGEYAQLGAQGWEQEGTGWYSDDAHGSAVYRAYNPHLTAGSHLFTPNLNEFRQLGALGWIQEGVAWYALR